MFSMYYKLLMYALVSPGTFYFYISWILASFVQILFEEVIYLIKEIISQTVAVLLL